MNKIIFIMLGLSNVLIPELIHSIEPEIERARVDVQIESNTPRNEETQETQPTPEKVRQRPRQDRNAPQGRHSIMPVNRTESLRVPVESRREAPNRSRPLREISHRTSPASTVLRNSSEESVRANVRQKINGRPRIESRLPSDVILSKARCSQRGNMVRTRFVDNIRRHHIFDDYFWKRFRSTHRHWDFDDHFSWSVEVSWPALQVWLPWRWNTPIYYHYGTDGIIYSSYSPESIHLIPVPSNQLFIAEAVRIANTPRPLYKNQNNWMPLGMFALSQDSEGGELAQEYLSLAISKDGLVSGAYVNVGDNETLEIEGAIDENSQRVVWKFVGQEWPVMESGLYNLTQEESSVLVHFSNMRTESRLFIRLNQPN